MLDMEEARRQNWQRKATRAESDYRKRWTFGIPKRWTCSDAPNRNALSATAIGGLKRRSNEQARNEYIQE